MLCCCYFNQVNKSEYITPGLASLPQLPVCFTIDFRIILITYKTLNGASLQYISDLLSSYTPACTSTSSGRGLLFVPD